MNSVDLLFYILVGCLVTVVPTLIFVLFVWRLIDEI